MARRALSRAGTRSCRTLATDGSWRDTSEHARAPVVELRGLGRTYGSDPPVQALRGVDLTSRAATGWRSSGRRDRASRRC